MKLKRILSSVLLCLTVLSSTVGSLSFMTDRASGGGRVRVTSDDWTVKPYLTFSSSSEFSIGTASNMKHWNGTLYYSTNASSWSVWNGTTRINSAGGKLYLRGVGNSIITGPDTLAYWTFSSSSSEISCDGNIENLLNWQVVEAGGHPTMGSCAFARLFYQQSKLVSPPRLEATTLSQRCYMRMFYECTSLKTAPVLPATTLVQSCYQEMFYGCTSLATPPKLLATTLATECYSSMFFNSGLKSLPELPATTLANYCYYFMFAYCSGIKVSGSRTGEYQVPYSIPGSNAYVSNTATGMFRGTGGTFVGSGNTYEVTVPHTYYLSTSNSVIPASS